MPQNIGFLWALLKVATHSQQYLLNDNIDNLLSTKDGKSFVFVGERSFRFLGGYVVTLHQFIQLVRFLC
jgi:hypothetical protein